MRKIENAIENFGYDGALLEVERITGGQQNIGLSKFIINTQDNMGLSALHWAAMKGNTRMTEAILSHKPFVNIQDFFGRTPLYLAVQYEHIDVVCLLLKSRALSSACNIIGHSILYICQENLIKSTIKINQYNTIIFNQIKQMGKHQDNKDKFDKLNHILEATENKLEIQK